MNTDKLVAIGKIAGTFAYAGLMKVIPLTDFPERFFKLDRVILNQGAKLGLFLIDGVKAHKNYYLFKFRGIDTVEAAREFQNAVLQIDESELYTLPEGYFYHFQLQGLSVYDVEKGLLGELKEIIETGANDVYVVASPQYGEILIPAIKDVILAVKLEEKRMEIKLLPGLLED
ncbi:MAG: ribosome maturation factor RimM [Syntrophomonas sp.]|uniref:ribosome maturation factor RimM n=1 Tax=Syntrophomonas sp. TaxID=2053627 RepID=UPI00263A0462|nr:ribosome maturation factor RimM [Syntrophomonas sp.]MDD2510978.1 ribosome maturation factor RimM [Syntrophomonas sp.]MDD3879203.1 ribosome maturation factor RimM [Syntrophomonas sp.]MDD4626470.1 ribosome maturation factor RimM [Syntrophomonas sp.]